MPSITPSKSRLDVTAGRSSAVENASGVPQMLVTTFFSPGTCFTGPLRVLINIIVFLHRFSQETLKLIIHNLTANVTSRSNHHTFAKARPLRSCNLITIPGLRSALSTRQPSKPEASLALGVGIVKGTLGACKSHLSLNVWFTAVQTANLHDAPCCKCRLVFGELDIAQRPPEYG